MAADTTVVFPFNEDGYVSATQMAKATKRKYFAWIRTDAAQDVIRKIGQQLTLSAPQLVRVHRGGNVHAATHGTWLHPTIAAHFARWCSPSCVIELIPTGLSATFPQSSNRRICPEKAISDALAVKVGGRREVPTPCGPADVVTADTVIEVKNFVAWKQAIGQVLVYASELNLKPHVHLFVQKKDRHRFMQSFAQIKKHMAAFNIELTFEHVA